MPPSRLRATSLLLLACSLLAGCNYVHFGRLDRTRSDSALSAENSDLRMEKKLLQQELAIARKEGDALRAALEQTASGTAAASPELVARLTEATRELATLRANYARLQSERAAAAGAPSADTAAALGQVTELKARLSDTEEKLAASLRTFTELQEENHRLRNTVDEARAENTTLSARLRVATAQTVEAQSVLSQLNTELLAQKESRARAEQIALSLRTQLQAVAAQSRSEPAATLAEARESAAAGANAIEPGFHAPGLPAATPSTAMLATNPARLRAPADAPAADATSASPDPQPRVADPSRTYVVKPSDTLEKIAREFYGRPERWTLLYAANNSQLSGGRPLKPGMVLAIPAE